MLNYVTLHSFIDSIFGMYLGQLEEKEGGRGKTGVAGRKQGETAMLWESVLGNQIKGKKGWTQRPLKAADSSPDMCLKRDAATDAKNRGKEGKKGREWAEPKRGERREDQGKGRR